MTTHEPETYWDHVYAEGDATKSWRQPRPRVSLSAIGSALGNEREAPIIDVGGGSSTLADELLTTGYTDVTVLDVSANALRLARERMGEAAERVNWIAADLLQWRPDREYALWHDRATLHFFVLESDRRRYAHVARAAIAPGGYAVIATFAPDGPTTCSGLPVHRSSPDGIAALLGAQFSLLSADHELHRTPRGAEQSFAWALLRRNERAGLVEQDVGERRP